MTISCNILEGFLKVHIHTQASCTSRSPSWKSVHHRWLQWRASNEKTAETWAGLQKQTRSDEGPRESQQLEAIITPRTEGTELLRSLKVEPYGDSPAVWDEVVWWGEEKFFASSFLEIKCKLGGQDIQGIFSCEKMEVGVIGSSNVESSFTLILVVGEIKLTCCMGLSRYSTYWQKWAHLVRTMPCREGSMGLLPSPHKSWVEYWPNHQTRACQQQHPSTLTCLLHRASAEADMGQTPREHGSIP